MGQLKVTASVLVVVIGIYIYYYYDSGHSELTNGWIPEKENAAGRAAGGVLRGRECDRTRGYSA